MAKAPPARFAERLLTRLGDDLLTAVVANVLDARAFCAENPALERLRRLPVLGLIAGAPRWSYALRA